MRLKALLAIVAASLVVLMAACIDGVTPDCTKPNSGCAAAPTDAAPGDSSTSDAAPDGSTSDATSDAPDDAAKPDAGDAQSD